MPKLNRNDFKKYAEDIARKKKEENENLVVILVGMGSCGIAAGARETMKAFKEQIEKRGIKHCVIKPTGCMGSCYVEPTVEIRMKDMPVTLYGKVKSDVVERIVVEHIINKRLVSELFFDKPAIDILG